MTTVYMMISHDEYELPLAVADTIRELAQMLGKNPKHHRLHHAPCAGEGALVKIHQGGRMMTYEEKVRWLRRYQDSLRREQELAEEVEQLRSRACKVTHSLSGMPGGTSDGQSLPRAVEQILEAQQELQAQIEQCNAIRQEIADTIERVTNPRDKDILRRRYLLGQHWEIISEDIGFSTKWVRHLHETAIQSIYITDL